MNRRTWPRRAADVFWRVVYCLITVGLVALLVGVSGWTVHWAWQQVGAVVAVAVVTAAAAGMVAGAAYEHWRVEGCRWWRDRTDAARDRATLLACRVDYLEGEMLRRDRTGGSR